ncbi:uncharacterized protein Ecym_8160 [Eremothecium cymbalariae DBVPG|uniref:Uncharacterized protein n=1 Tax=Eremothecium cymbalariae (strain CBS 270.75 / DBVPG 7215 / KCTC 17166 / NRRL Y-17582) TaxID=931890 RepID=G8JX73_ERECY|nr:Hypothetical protein Ecym_8160 [Eremothecium cymbalariae DBVPG\
MESVESIIKKLEDLNDICARRECKDVVLWNSLNRILHQTTQSMFQLVEQTPKFSRRDVYSRHSPFFNKWDKSESFRILPPIPSKSEQLCLGQEEDGGSNKWAVADLPLLEQLNNLRRLVNDSRCRNENQSRAEFASDEKKE